MKRLPFLLVAGLILDSCAPQVEGVNSIKTNAVKKTKTVAAETKKIDQEGGEIAAEDGSKLVVPPGALASVSDVSMAPAEAPPEFAVGGSVKSASSPLEIKASGADGKAITTAKAPMTVNLSLQAAGLRLVADSTDDLCVLLKSAADELFVWRRNSISLNENLGQASIQSIYFGIFQLVYCGNEPLPGFSEATQTGASGSLTATIEFAPTYASKYGHDKYCLFVFREQQECQTDDGDCASEFVILGKGEEAVTENAEVTVNASFGSEGVIGDHKHLVAVFFESKGKICPFQNQFKITKNEPFEARAFFAFEVSADDLRNGITGSFGSAPYALAEIEVSLGAPDHIQVAPFQEDHFCLEAEGSGMAMVSVEGDANGLLEGEAAYKLSYPLRDSEPALHITVGEKCASFKGPAGNSSATGRPYRVEFPQVSVEDINYLSPVTLHFTSANIPPVAVDSCLLLKNSEEDSELSHDLGEIGLQVAKGKSLPVYLPFLYDASYRDTGTPQYDMLISIGTCDDLDLDHPQNLEIEDKPLTADIDI